jgi:NSS family neurotransmitter:Na+ symporter
LREPPSSAARGVPREAWSSRAGFVLASIGAAVGIGNIWRFPYMVGTNGGGAFLIPYLIAVAFLGLPLMIAELALGRHFGTSVVPAFAAMGKRVRCLGLVLVFILTMILAYYLVVTGWVLAWT